MCLLLRYIYIALVLLLKLNLKFISPPPRPAALRTAITKDLDGHNTSLSDARAGVEAPLYYIYIVYSIYPTCSELGIWIMSLLKSLYIYICRTPFFQACVARGGSSDDLVTATQTLTTTISAYKQAAKTVKGLCAKPKPKAKPADTGAVAP